MLKIIDTVRSQARDLRCVIRKDTDLGEFVVRLYANGKAISTDADYFTDDLSDAINSAHAMLKQAEQQRLGSEFIFPAA